MHRLVEVELVTDGGSVRGFVQVPPGGRLSERLNDDAQFIPVVESTAQMHPSLVNKDRIALVYEISDPDQIAGTDMMINKFEFAVKIGAGDIWIEGKVKLVADANLNLFVHQLRNRFLPVLAATVKQQGEETRTVPVVIVNRMAIVTIDQSAFTAAS